MSTPNAHRRRIWPWAVAGVVVLVGVAAGVGFLLGGRGAPMPPSPSPTASSSSATVDACAGGTNVTAATLQEAQLNAAHTPEGAVSYAAAFARYVLRVPWPTDAEEAAANNALSVDRWESWRDSADSWTGPTPMTTTTATGSYAVLAYSPEAATVTVALPMVVDGAISPTRTFAPTLTLIWTVGDNWSVSELDASALENPAQLQDATEFIEGC